MGGTSQENFGVGWMRWRDTKQRPSGHVGPLPLCKKVKAPFGSMCQGYGDPERPAVQLFQRAPGAGHVVGSLSLKHMVAIFAERSMRESRAGGAREFQG